MGGLWKAVVKVFTSNTESDTCLLRNAESTVVQGLWERNKDLEETNHRLQLEKEKFAADARSHISACERDNNCLNRVLTELMSDLENISQEKSLLSDHLGKAERDLLSLRKTLRDMEVQNRQTAALGSYLDSKATPNDVQSQADLIRQCLTFFTKTLMKVLVVRDPSGQCQKLSFEKISNILPTLQGVNLAKTTDVKFAFQKIVSDIVFQGFWGEDFILSESLQSDFDAGKIQDAYLRRYKDFKQMENCERTRLVRLVCEHSGAESLSEPFPSCAQPTCLSSVHDCLCGWKDFQSFCNEKYKALILELKQLGLESNLWNPSQDRLQDFESSANEFKEDFVSLVANVWLAHLLTRTFDQSPTLFKVKRGQKISTAYMEPATSDHDMRRSIVAFMIVPGFRVGKSIVRCHVYLQHEASDI